MTIEELQAAWGESLPIRLKSTGQTGIVVAMDTLLSGEHHTLESCVVRLADSAEEVTVTDFDSLELVKPA